MRIISTTDISRVVNGSTIYQTLSLVEKLDVYSVISFMKIIDYAGEVLKAEFSILDNTQNREQAIYVYRHNGGKLDEAIFSN